MRLIKTKIQSSNELKNIILRLKRQGKKVAFTNGCFDILHFGHINYLERAKRTADILVVAVNSDSSIKKIKGNARPVTGLKERIGIIAALECVDFVTSFSQDTPLQIIKLLKPDILIKGADWSKNEIVGKEAIESSGGSVITLPYIKGYSSSRIINKIAKAF